MEFMLGIDTHADSSCAGKHVRILEYIDGKTFSVKPFLLRLFMDGAPLRENWSTMSLSTYIGGSRGGL